MEGTLQPPHGIGCASLGIATRRVPGLNLRPAIPSIPFLTSKPQVGVIVHSFPFSARAEADPI